MMFADLVAILVYLFFSALFSGSEIGLYSVSRVKLRYQLEQQHLRARVLQWLLHPPGPTIITILIGNNIAALLLTTTTEKLFHGYEAWSVLITPLVLTPVVLLFGEFLPKYLFRQKANLLMYQMVYLLALARILCWLPMTIAHHLSRALQRLLGTGEVELWEPHTSRTNLRNFLNAEASGHSLTPVQKQLINRVMALERLDCTYYKVSKPLHTLATLDSGATVAAARNGLEAPYFTRYLITDHQDAQPTGYISAATLATADGRGSIAELAQPLPILPRTTSLAVALERMHQLGADLALLTDSDGRTSDVLFRNDCLRVLVRME
jgi:putative hemolysin